MKVDVETVTLEPERVIPAVTEKQYVLRLSEHEARVLRALYGKTRDGMEKIRFLAPLDLLFPRDCYISYDGIAQVRIKTAEEEKQ